jgi:hypothetical protein
MKKTYFALNCEEERDDHEKRKHKLIVDDVNRTLPESDLFKYPII